MIDWVLPILHWAISPTLLDATTTLRSILIPSISFYLFLRNPVNIKNFRLPLILFILITAGYIISWQLNDQNLINFLFGAYGRGLGILTLVGVFLYFMLCAEYYGSKIQQIMRVNYLVLIFCLTYIIIQIIGVDPLPWEKGAGPGGTLGNPNFSSALMGMLSVIPLHYLLRSRRILNIHSFIYIATFFAIYKTNSRQGVILFILGLFLTFVIYTIKGSNSWIKSKTFYFVAIVTTVSGVFFFFRNFSQLDSALQIRNRIEHWKIGYQIWQDYPLFGIGIDNIQRYAGQYRNLQMREWGLSLIPDRLHNTFIDFFVTGGVIVGFLWLFFIVFTLRKIYNCFIDENFELAFIPLAIIWILYLIQCFFSPDQLVIMMCAISAVGSLIGFEQTKKVK